jgi:serine/threonine protein kinase
VIPSKGFRLDRLLTISIELTDALHAAHSRGVVHRDLKPSNVMISSGGAVKVLDFGLSQIAASEAGGRFTTETLTADHRLIGTVPYMSPEQIEGRPADKRSDIFSLGVMLFEMATGRRPFTGAAPLATMTLHSPVRSIRRCPMKSHASSSVASSRIRIAACSLRRTCAISSTTSHTCCNPGPGCRRLAAARPGGAHYGGASRRGPDRRSL